MISDHLQAIDFNKKLKSWYLKNHRPLLWRQTTDPYKIWLSEIILQQTRVTQGTPYYEKFLENYPTVFDLAHADERDVLRLWQGLGYYSRARNMHFTARQIVSEFGGKFPETALTLSKLKGLGNYTAAAIASFAFNEAVAAIDGNVYRVMSRIFGIKSDMLSNEGKKEFAKVAKTLISQEDPATYNQAMIEFGALQCVPVSPNCTICPFNDICYAYAFNVQNELPVKAKKMKVKNRFLNYFIIQQGEKLAMQERTTKDIWKGLYDFVLVESTARVDSPEDLADSVMLLALLRQGSIRQVPKPYIHLLTHQKLHVQFWWVTVPENEHLDLPENIYFFSKNEVETLPKPILIDTVLKEEKYL
ncbi:A/G-specific adenine glycosylase [Dyadobacter fanqingshengii]|uniref:Adenine DNA glycosylase n=1 Tax=Dyadobacter fanqingshengii TaxID=2906443 RepID=A0A9X1P952_9BACT|nr:A/G-specific adenine glycosylase [Dyadobacter fanqingshengii]MCF0038940.1 A/G-specific adenine glycosylase [Dyadobacter fanqingshengii]USJ34237.1 A/G-specific adenine glycosylase [Dyadobacter fanqingshengii]